MSPVIITISGLDYISLGSGVTYLHDVRRNARFSQVAFSVGIFRQVEEDRIWRTQAFLSNLKIFDGSSCDVIFLQPDTWLSTILANRLLAHKHF